MTERGRTGMGMALRLDLPKSPAVPGRHWSGSQMLPGAPGEDVLCLFPLQQPLSYSRTPRDGSEHLSPLPKVLEKSSQLGRGPGERRGCWGGSTERGTLGLRLGQGRGLDKEAGRSRGNFRAPGEHYFCNRMSGAWPCPNSLCGLEAPSANSYPEVCQMPTRFADLNVLIPRTTLLDGNSR